MKRFLFVIVCLLVVSFAVSAQPGQRGDRQQRSPEENAKRNTEWMKTELKLTEDQIAPVDSINLVYAKAQAKLRESANGDFSSMRENMQKLEALRLEAYEKVLTEEQIQAYKKFIEERRQRGPGQGGPGGRRGGNN